MSNNKTPLREVPRKDREEALRASKATLLERYFRLSEELPQIKAQIEKIDSQLLVMQGLELSPPPPAD